MYYLYPAKNSEVFDRLIKGFIKAGFKGDPSDYYKVKEENKLTGQEIQELILGKTIEGLFYGFPWTTKINNNGESEHNDFFGTHKGKIWIEGDAVCRQDETRFDGLKDCADLYKNPEGDKNRLSEYLSLTDFWIFPFSIKKNTK